MNDAYKEAVADPATDGLEVYIVGGAVRDELLGLPAGDRDWVVVGATPEAMAARGFVPVGGDFPVFLHPRTKEEYALARTERKSGRGYKGFTFHTGTDVTLEDDLKRRDLTINAIARAPDGKLLDPLGGLRDIRNKVLRHVGQAFIEDPVRLLRLARFAARFHDFTIAAPTMELARRLVEDGEVDALVPERVWRELAKGLATEQPVRLFDVLQATGALERVLPGLVFNDAIGAPLACASRAGLSLAARFALLCRLSDEPGLIGKRVRAPADCQDYARLLPAVLAWAEDEGAGATGQGNASPLMGDLAQERARLRLKLIEHCDALRKPERFLEMIAAAGCVVEIDFDAWQARVAAVRSVDAGAIAKAVGGRAAEIKPALQQARLDALMLSR